MIAIWYGLVALSLVIFAVTDGRNFGVGVMLHSLGRDIDERRAVTALLGPQWSWDEVWLVAAFGTLFLAFPKVLAIGLSGYYLAVFVLLWSLIVRGIALEMAFHVTDAMWLGFWHGVFSFSSVLLALCFGAAFGNVVRGVPLGADGRMFLPFFTDFSARGAIGIFDWYTLLVAIFTLALLAAHGATFVALKSSGELAARARVSAKRGWLAAMVLLVVVSVGTAFVRRDFFGALVHHAIGWLSLMAMIAGLAAVMLGTAGGMDRLAWRGSCLTIAGMLGGAAAAVYPEMLHSTVAPVYSVTAQDGASGHYGLVAAIIWWPIAAALSAWYYLLVAKRYPERDATAIGTRTESPRSAQ